MKKRDLLLLTISAFIIIIAWISFNVYHSFSTSTITDIVNTQIQEINPTFNTNVIETLSGRTQIVPLLEISENSATISTNLSPSPIPSVSPSPTIPITPTIEISSPITITPIPTL